MKVDGWKEMTKQC